GRREGGAAAGNEEQDEIVLPGAVGQLEKPRRGVKAALVGHGVARFGELDAPERDRAAVLDNDEPAGDAIAQDFLGGGGHGAAGLAAAEDEDAPATDREVRSHERADVARPERRRGDGARPVSRRHERRWRRRSPASRRLSSGCG